MRTGQVDPERDLQFPALAADAESALARLHRTLPEGEDLVVCHGDYCLPNVLLTDGEVSATST